MKLVETDEDDPSAHPEPPVRATPPRPEKRQVMVSLVLTVTVLAGTVIAVFTVFPERHNQLVASTLAEHRRPGPWDLPRPDAAALEVWMRAVLGEGPPVPAAAPALVPIGARAVTILSRRAALVRYAVGGDGDGGGGDGGGAGGGDEVTYLVQRARDIPHRRVRERDRDDSVEGWRRGPWTCVAVGPARSADRWRPLLGVP